MPKDKDRTLNPAAAARKAEKVKALKKSKTAIQAQRTERLAQRNPHRLETQISALKDGGGGKLNTRDAKHLTELEAELARVKRAREKVGAPAPAAGAGGYVKREGGDDDGGSTRGGRGRGRGGGGGYAGLGKRRRGDVEDAGSSSGDDDETDEEVRKIPWPRDTPPPIPPARSRRNANTEPLGRERRRHPPAGSNDDGKEEDKEEGKPDLSLPQKPGGAGGEEEKVAPRTTYESKAQVRDLRKEATARFMPSVVKRKMDAGKGRGPGGRLLEEEEVQRLEGEGYKFGGSAKVDAEDRGGEDEGKGDGMTVDAAPAVALQDRGDGNVALEKAEARRLREEEEAFERDIAADMQGEEAKEDAAAGVAEPTPPKKRTMQASVEEQSDEEM